MSRSTAQQIAVVLAVIAALIFLGVAQTELGYASDHPNAYGPAKVIATGAIGGAVLAAAVALLAFAFGRRD
jgi:hypothetical protein